MKNLVSRFFRKVILYNLGKYWNVSNKVAVEKHFNLNFNLKKARNKEILKTPGSSIELFHVFLHMQKHIRNLIKFKIAHIEAKY